MFLQVRSEFPDFELRVVVASDTYDYPHCLLLRAFGCSDICPNLIWPMHTQKRKCFATHRLKKASDCQCSKPCPQGRSLLHRTYLVCRRFPAPAAIFVDPYLVDFNSQGLRKALTLPEIERQARIAEGKAWSAKFWKAAALAYLEIYKELFR